MSDHAKISPSQLSRILACPGSLQKCEKVKNESSIYAEEGTMLHEVTEYCLSNSESVPDKWKRNDDVIILDTEQQSVIQDCLDYYAMVLEDCGDNPVTEFEKTVYLEKFDPEVLSDCWGTADVIIKAKEVKTLHVVDWKFGKGIQVYAADNDQALAYAAGAIGSWQSLDSLSLTTDTKIVLHIAQPRFDSYSTYELVPSNIANWLNTRLRPGIEKALAPSAPLIPGTVQCRWCSARGTCRARYVEVQKVASGVFAAHARLSEDVTPAEIAGLLSQADLLKTYLSELKATVTAAITSGQKIPGWKLVSGRSTRKWKNEATTEEWLLGHLGYDEVYKIRLVSPAQAEKALRQLKKNAKFQDLIIKPPGAPTLVKAADKRKAIEFRTAEEVFDKIAAPEVL